MNALSVRQAAAKARAALGLPAETLPIFLYHCLSIGMSLAASVPVARLLGPTQKGVLNLFSLLTGLLAEFGVFGTNSGLLYELANRKTPLASVHAAAVKASALLGCGCLGALLVFWPAFSRAFDGLPGYFVLISGLMAPFLLYRALWGSLVIGMGRAVHSYRVNFFFSVLALAGLLLLWEMELVTAANIIWLNIGLLAAYCAYGIRYLARLHEFRFVWSGPSFLAALKYGAVVHVGVMANYLHFRADQLMINYFQGPRGVGIYTVSVAAAELIWLIDYAIINASLFRISSIEAGASWRLTRRLFLLTTTILIGAGLLLGSVAGPLVRLLYGAEFLDAVLPLRILLLGVIAWGSARLFSQFISYNAGKPYLCTAAAVGAMALNVVGNLYTIPRWGLPGAALTSSLSYLVNAGLVGVVFVRLGRRYAAPDALAVPRP